jgi:outer membrane protein assembly factor BamB
VDGDGIDEVACGTEYYWWHLANAQGQKVWSYSTSTGPTANACAIGDLSGDGKRETLFGGADGNVHAIGPDGALLWKLNTGDEVTALSCTDTDGDGAEEVLVGSLSSNVYALRGDGSMIWRTDVGSPVVGLCATDGKCCALTAPGEVFILSASSGEWSAMTKLGVPGLRIGRGLAESSPLVVTTEGGGLVGLTW